jgi:tetratricopeptide (TPR) repeat protein
MSRRFAAGILFTVALACAGRAQQPTTPTPAAPASEPAADLPPEEDKAEQPKEYSFNPLQSKKEITAGEFYFKKSNFRAAAIRFREATKWNDGNAEAWLRLAETEEKNHEDKAAKAAYEKYLQLSPTAKNAAEIRKRVEKLKG